MGERSEKHAHVFKTWASDVCHLQFDQAAGKAFFSILLSRRRSPGDRMSDASRPPRRMRASRQSRQRGGSRNSALPGPGSRRSSLDRFQQFFRPTAPASQRKIRLAHLIAMRVQNHGPAERAGRGADCVVIDHSIRRNQQRWRCVDLRHRFGQGGNRRLSNAERRDSVRWPHIALQRSKCDVRAPVRRFPDLPDQIFRGCQTQTQGLVIIGLSRQALFDQPDPTMHEHDGYARPRGDTDQHRPAVVIGYADCRGILFPAIRLGSGHLSSPVLLWRRAHGVSPRALGIRFLHLARQFNPHKQRWRDVSSLAMDAPTRLASTFPTSPPAFMRLDAREPLGGKLSSMVV